MNGPGVHDPKKCLLCAQFRHPSQASNRRGLASHPLPAQRRSLMWGSDADERAIPILPGPRATSDVPRCCNRPMTVDGDQYVCSRCHGYHQPGTQA